MPYPNMHSVPVKSKGDFEKDSFRSKEIAPGIILIMGKVKGGNGSMVTKSYHFSTDKFTAEEAKKWLKDHKINPMSFEAATSSKNESIVTNQFQKINQDGKDYLVVPGVILQEQVMNDYLVPADEIEKCAQAWNGRPIVVYHPKKNNGSANVPNPDVRTIGRFFNAKWNEDTKRLTGENWIDVAEAQKSSEGITVLNKIYMNEPIENSTGYFADEEYTQGEFSGRAYNLIHRNLKPDHIAILPDKVGACSIKDGCGMNVNCQSECPCKSDVNTEALRAVLDGRGSSANFPANALDSAPNTARNQRVKSNQKGVKNMKWSDVVAFLKGKKIEVKTNEVDGEMQYEITEEPTSEPAPAPLFNAEEVTALKSLAEAGPAILNALKEIPAAVQMAQNAQTQAVAQKTELIATIKANESNQYSEDELKAMPQSALVKLNAQLNTSFEGAGGGRQIANDEKPLVAPPVLLAKKEA